MGKYKAQIQEGQIDAIRNNGHWKRNNKRSVTMRHGKCSNTFLFRRRFRWFLFLESLIFFSRKCYIFRLKEEKCDWIGNPARCTFDSKQNRIVPDANIIPIIPEKKHSSYNWRISCKNRITKKGQIVVLSFKDLWTPSNLGVRIIYLDSFGFTNQ